MKFRSSQRGDKNQVKELKRVLYLPMEIASRELDSRLLLSALALKRGYDVVLGQKWLIERNIDSMPPGIYLSKTLTQRDATSLRRAKDRGYLVAAIDEEMPGLVTSSDELRWISDEAVAVTDRIFVSGDHNTASVRKRFPAASNRVISALNPRWDLLRPSLREFYKQDAAEIRQRFGSFILINTNLGLTNSEKGSVEEIISEQERLGKLSMANPEHVTYVNGILAMEAANRGTIIRLIDELPKRFPDRRIILRPHPSERLDTWREQIDGHAVVDVIRDGPAIPWILAADVLVHTNCTTGVEAAALDTPAICVLPTETMVNNRYLSNRVNPVARTVEETMALVNAAVSLGSTDSFYSDEMRTAFRAAMSYDDNCLGAERMLDELEQAVSEEGFKITPPTNSSQWRPGLGYAWNLEDKNVRGALFPSLTLEYAKARITAITQTLGVTVASQAHECGSKVMLLSAHNLHIDVRLRRFFSMKRAA